MSTFKIYATYVAGVIIAILLMKAFRDILPQDGAAPLFIFIIIISVVVALTFYVTDSASNKLKDISEKNKLKSKVRADQKELEENMRSNIEEYKEFKNSFQYFSDDSLKRIYQKYLNGEKNSDLEQLALEEEMVKRKLLKYSPMHEKLYHLKKILK